MVISGQVDEVSSYDRMEEVKAFDETKAGVKGLVDAGVTKIPRMFINSMHDDIAENTDPDLIKFSGIPLMDLEGIEKDVIHRKQVVDQIRQASKEWGFFQVTNHGIPSDVLDEMIAGTRRFHEQPTEVKKKFYTRDQSTKRFLYSTNFDLFQAPAANWRDTFYCVMAPESEAVEPDELPTVCRDIIIKYTEHATRLAATVLELLSEALGLEPNHLKDIGCADGISLIGHYYPACPEPELTMGSTKHADNDFLTILVQDQMGGLQVLHQNQWVDVLPKHGDLVVNIGDLLQLISNDVLKSSEHRVRARDNGPRVSASFFCGNRFQSSKLFGPMKELISETNPPIYREVTVQEYVAYYYGKGLDGVSALTRFKLIGK